MPDVLKILQCSNFGGMEQSVYRLMPRLQAAGVDFRIVTPRPFGPGEPRLKSVDPDARAFPYKGKFGWRTFGTFSRCVAGRAAGASHIWLTGTDITSLRAMKPLGQRKLLGHHFHHGGPPGTLFKWWGFYNGFCKQLDAVTYPGDFTRNEALHIAPWLRHRSHVVPYAFEVAYDDEAERAARREAARGALGLPQGAWIVGNAGWLIQRKRWDVFLQTASLVAEAIPEARFVICGGGPEEATLRDIADALGLGKKVYWAGWQADVNPWYDAMDALLFNSDFDAFCLTPCEAGARGTNVVASLVSGGLGELIRDGEDGFLMREHQPQELARRLRRLHDEPALAAGLRASLAARLRERHDPARTLAFYTDFFGA